MIEFVALSQLNPLGNPVTVFVTVPVPLSVVVNTIGFIVLPTSMV